MRVTCLVGRTLLDGPRQGSRRLAPYDGRVLLYDPSFTTALLESVGSKSYNIPLLPSSGLISGCLGVTRRHDGVIPPRHRPSSEIPHEPFDCVVVEPTVAGRVVVRKQALGFLLSISGGRPAERSGVE